MSRPREWTVPYPASVDNIESMVRRWIRAGLTPGERRRRLNNMLTAEYGARRPRYSLIRFLKAHR